MKLSLGIRGWKWDGEDRGVEIIFGMLYIFNIPFVVARLSMCFTHCTKMALVPGNIARKTFLLSPHKGYPNLYAAMLWRCFEWY